MHVLFIQESIVNHFMKKVCVSYDWYEASLKTTKFIMIYYIWHNFIILCNHGIDLLTMVVSN